MKSEDPSKRGRRANELGPVGHQVARNLEDLREARRLTQKELAARMTALGRPVTMQMVSKMEQGERRVDADDLTAAAIALGVNVSALLLPRDADEDDIIELTPEVRQRAGVTWKWADGAMPFPEDPLPVGQSEAGSPWQKVADFQRYARPLVEAAPQSDAEATLRRVRAARDADGPIPASGTTRVKGRVLCLDGEEFWREFIKGQLLDHHVDAVGSFQEAVDLLQSSPAYDAALVDFDRHGEDNGEGGELLEFLELRYPETKRIAVTGRPPGGAVMRLITAHGLEDLIIKGRFGLPDLRQAVQKAIAARPGELPRTLRLNRWTLQQRSRDWDRVQSDRIKEEVTAAERYLSDVAGIRGQAREEAEEAAVSARLRAAQFREVSMRVREMVNNINSEADFDAALTAQEHAEEQFANDV